MAGALGRREPTDFSHVVKYPLRSLEFAIPPEGSEKSLGLPWWWKQHDQRAEGSCVGFGSSAMMSVTNHYQRLQATGRDMTYRYACRWLYQQAQLVDEWDDTPPAEGTSVDAACKVLRDVGHRRVQNGVIAEPNPAQGISSYHWAETIDDVRSAIWSGLAVAIGINWYSNFDDPVVFANERWIGRSPNLGYLRGGHCVCLFRFSDRRQAVRMMNNWGEAYAPVWIPYDVLERLMGEYGEVVAITDR